MKIIYGLIIAALTAILLPLLTEVNIADNILSTLYTVVGVIFSVGMSLVISVSTSGIKNTDAKNSFRDQLKKIRSRFIGFFVVLSILYVLLFPGQGADIFVFSDKYPQIVFNKKLFLAASLFGCIIYYIINYYSIQQTVYDIEDRIINEEKQQGNSTGDQ